MDIQILVGLLLTVMPVVELRGGLPVVVHYVTERGLNVWPYFAAVLLLNILVIFFVFFFLDFIHEYFMKIRFYKKFMDKYIERIRIKGDKLEKRMQDWGYVALALFVSVPLPGTGAWTGCLVAWLLGLERKKSILAISIGVIIAGFIILFASLGFFSLF